MWHGPLERSLRLTLFGSLEALPGRDSNLLLFPTVPGWPVVRYSLAACTPDAGIAGDNHQYLQDYPMKVNYGPS